MAVNLLGQLSTSRADGLNDHDDSDEEKAAMIPMTAGGSSTQGNIRPSTGGAYGGGGGQTTIEMGGQEAGSNPFAALTSNFKDDQDPETYMGTYENLKSEILDIDNNSDKIERLHNQFKMSDNPNDDAKIMENLDMVMANNSHLTKSIKIAIEKAKSENDEYGKKKEGSSIAQWRKTQLNTVARQFRTSCANFQQKLNAFNTELQNKQRRQLQNFQDNDNPLTEEQLDQFSRNPKVAAEVIQNQVGLQSVGDLMLDRLVELEARYEGMVKIEQELRELQQMFQDLHILIDAQQLLLDDIEKHCLMTKDYVESGTKALGGAEKHQKFTRKMQCCLCCFCFILVIILMMFLGFNGNLGSS